VSLTTLEAVCESVRYGYTASANNEPCGPKFLRITDIVPDQINWDSVPYCQIDERDQEKYLLEPGDIVVARTGATVGYAKLIREPVQSVFASYLVRFRIDPVKADPRFVGKLIESSAYKAFINSRIGGAAQPNASAPVLGSFQFVLPSQNSQKRIFEILSSFDDLIENNGRRIRLLEESARLLYCEWFVRLRFPGHEHVRLKNGVPESWGRKSAFDVMQVLSGGTPKTSVLEYWGGDIPFFTPKDNGDAAYVLSTEKTLTESGLRNCNSRLYPKDTLFITARGTVGNLNLAQVPMAMNQSCYALAAKPPLTQHFLYCALKTAIAEFKSRAVGAVFDAIVVDTFKLIPFVVPPEKLVIEFQQVIQPMFQQIDKLLQQTQKLRQARDLLLPRLMSGEIRV
jgi:type I restriction enzyme S subunit